MENKQKIFDQLFTQYRDWIFRLCYSYTRSEIQAEDLVQECFSKVWLNLSSFEHRSDYSTWIYRIAANTCLMQLRREKNNPVEYHQKLKDGSSEDRQEYNEDRSTVLYNAIALLNEIDRIIISMVLEDIPQKQIGEVLGITENNVNIKVYRIKRQLKELLSKNN
ncbi:sigma-70 family RNA polymerase sigma factor [Flavobacterium sp. GA093]|uniref:Sigma-70 family RNA polymerase sigma factor n=1 Tax=Flavobacterium hydrocarbonoxydans TaxID=2683249 RepID=A0A6I4NEW0_9FLAO|nr:sigma-70 family RNA polymerase sigma factor [Flavobacterium hydrocarbonoxydans]MWB93070.1 sigma-70 family RNA polymerase sigma factor [Flavobacterium hydrocarbonoxydans]